MFGDGTAAELLALIGLAGLIASFFTIIYAYGRNTYSLSRAGYFPKWLSVTHPTRNTPHVALIAGAIVGYALVPTAPPRLFPQEGFVDTITDFAQVNHDSGLVKLFINTYAAIPSMHVAFSTMIGITGVLVSRHKITKFLWAAYPVLVFWVVVVTANHFWIDGAAGLLVAALATLAARSLARARPAVWSFRPATT